MGSNNNQLYLIELEWRRADPADNAAELFRHLAIIALVTDSNQDDDGEMSLTSRIFRRVYNTFEMLEPQRQPNAVHR